MTPATVKDLLDYVDGVLYWRVNKNRAKAGSVAGFTSALGYRCVGVNGRYYPAHRLVWLWHGRVLPRELDHINGNKTDNRIENLRPATRGENMRNVRLRKDNATGIKGVDFYKGKHRARIAVDKKTVYLGNFDSLEEAKNAITTARNKHHNKFARHQ